MVVSAAMGLGVNALSPKGIPLMYTPPKELDVAGTKVRLLDEKQAYEAFQDPFTTFVDTRKPEDYAQERVKGALAMNPDEMESQFMRLQPLLREDRWIVLYCYGPECDMAEKVAGFLVQFGYSDLSIMSAGYRAWADAGFPIEASPAKKRAKSGDAR
jgi:rhodanese-related sulfurtransferase